MIALVALLLLQGTAPDSTIARAESTLAAGDVQIALKLARKVAARRPRDAQAHLLLGRVHYARPVIGRYPALEEFKIAARLDPHDPAPLYWQMKVGFYLRSDEGDVIAREALLRLFAVAPDYADAWDRFRDVYQDRKIWRRAEQALARHGEQPVALERRAELLIALGDGSRADSLLSIATARGRVTTANCLLRSEANFLAGRAVAGYAWHDSALARADVDSSGALWDEAWSIASPDEIARHAATPPGERRAFFARFWDERDPNLLTVENERLREHHGRRAEARRTYRLLHPQRSAYHSTLARTLASYEARGALNSLAAEVPGATGPSSDPSAAAARVAGLRWSESTLQDSAQTHALRAGLTAQGLVFLRYGRPDRQAPCVTDLLRPFFLASPDCLSHLDQEAWMYWTPQGPLSMSFRGNEYFFPISSAQVRSSVVALQTDRTTQPAPLVVRSWSAVFNSADLGLTDVYYKARGDSAAVVLRDGTGNALRASGPGLLRLTAPPGSYELGFDVDSAGVLGRTRSSTKVPAFSFVDLGLSTLVLAPTTPGAPLPDREAALRGMPADLRYGAGAPLASYVEVYGLSTGRDGRSRYRVRYAFAPVRSVIARLVGASRPPTVFEFERETESSMAHERLVIEPDRVPAGRYRVTVAVTDLARNVKSESVALEIEIR